MTFDEIAGFLKDESVKNYILLTHKSPDGDTLGSGFALCRVLKNMGKKVKILGSDGFPDRYDFLYEGYTEDSLGENEPHRVIAVDIADTSLMGKNLEYYTHPNTVDLCIDHHISNKMYAKQSYVDGSASATGLVLFELFDFMGIDIDKQTAVCLYTAIATDTGCFKYENTTPRAHIAAAALMEKGVDYTRINRLMFDIKSRRRIEVEQAALINMEQALGGRVTLICVTKELLETSGADEAEISGLSAVPLTVEGTDVGVTIRYKDDDRYKLSVRTTDKADASAICKEFGGGGHIRAAGCEINAPLDEVKRMIISAAQKHLS